MFNVQYISYVKYVLICLIICVICDSQKLEVIGPPKEYKKHKMIY